MNRTCVLRFNVFILFGHQHIINTITCINFWMILPFSYDTDFTPGLACRQIDTIPILFEDVCFLIFNTFWGCERFIVQDSVLSLAKCHFLSGSVANVLQQAALPLVDRSECQRLLPEYNITTRMVCAGYPEGGVDTCQVLWTWHQLIPFWRHTAWYSTCFLFSVLWLYPLIGVSRGTLGVRWCVKRMAIGCWQAWCLLG